MPTDFLEMLLIQIGFLKVNNMLRLILRFIKSHVSKIHVTEAVQVVMYVIRHIIVSMMVIPVTQASLYMC